MHRSLSFPRWRWVSCEIRLLRNSVAFVSCTAQQQRLCSDSWEIDVWDLLRQTYQMCHNPGLKIQRKTIRFSVAHTSVIVTYQKSVLTKEIQRRFFRHHRGYGEQDGPVERRGTRVKDVHLPAHS